jgi:beta-lactamase class A
MIHFNKIFIIILILTASTFAQSLSELKENIQKLLSTQNGTFAIAFQELKNPDNAILINKMKFLIRVCTIKTCIMVQIYKEIFENSLSLNQPVKIVNSFNSVVDNSTYNMNLETLTWIPFQIK